MRAFHHNAQIVGALAAVLMLLAACGTANPSASPVESGATDATPTDATPTVDATDTPTPTAPVTTTAAPTPIESGGWPYPADCISYDPHNLAVVPDGSVYRVRSGGTTLLTFRDEYEAETGQSLAQAYAKLCFVGRNTEPSANVITYWLNPSDIQTGYESSEAYRCDNHNPGSLSVSATSSGWRVQTGSTTIYEFQTETAARQAKVVLSHYEIHCVISWDHLPHTGPYIHEFFEFQDWNQ